MESVQQKILFGPLGIRKSGVFSNSLRLLTLVLDDTTFLISVMAIKRSGMV